MAFTVLSARVRPNQTDPKPPIFAPVADDGLLAAQDGAGATLRPGDALMPRKFSGRGLHEVSSGEDLICNQALKDVHWHSLRGRSQEQYSKVQLRYMPEGRYRLHVQQH